MVEQIAGKRSATRSVSRLDYNLNRPYAKLAIDKKEVPFTITRYGFHPYLTADSKSVNVNSLSGAEG